MATGRRYPRDVSDPSSTQPTRIVTLVLVTRDGSILGWNLSSLWRLPLTSGAAWLKVVPPFFAHEGALLERLAGDAVPTLLGHDGPRMFMPEIPGDDRYDAPLPELLAMVDLLVDLQRRWVGRSDELIALGLPDWRGDALALAIADVVSRSAPELPDVDRSALDAFVDELPQRIEAIAGCGLADSLVHGDFHPGTSAVPRTAWCSWTGVTAASDIPC